MGLHRKLFVAKCFSTPSVAVGTAFQSEPSSAKSISSEKSGGGSTPSPTDLRRIKSLTPLSSQTSMKPMGSSFTDAMDEAGMGTSDPLGKTLDRRPGQKSPTKLSKFAPSALESKKSMEFYSTARAKFETLDLRDQKSEDGKKRLQPIEKKTHFNKRPSVISGTKRKIFQ